MQDSQSHNGGQGSEVGGQRSGRTAGRTSTCSPFPFRLSPRISDLRPLTSRRQAFTLTELLIVIAIIAVLAGLIAAAAVNAMKAARRGQIVLEIKNISGAIENFKNDYGAYPPNGMSEAPTFTTSGTAAALVKSDFTRMFKKAFPQHNEPSALIEALAGVTPASSTIVTGGPLKDGMRANEALYFWLGGFSSDEQYPLSGPGGPSFIVGGTSLGEVLEDRSRRYEFDLGRLGPRTEAGAFDATKGRSIQYTINKGTGNENRQINFWQYTPSGSEQPLVYFDVSRHKPGIGAGKYDIWAANPADGFPYIYAVKQLREGVTAVGGKIGNVAFVNQGKFQILHAGLDDDWGSDNFKAMGIWSVIGNDPDDLLFFPEGPFIGPIADTLTSFSDGTLADAAEE